MTSRAGESVEPQERSFLGWWDAKCYSNFGRHFVTKRNILLPYHLAIN
jgi:hypothetical protein